MLCILGTIKCVGRGNDGFCKIGGWSLSEILGHRNQRDRVLLEFALEADISDRIAKKPRLAVNENYIEGRGIDASCGHHPLEFGPLVITSARARIDKFANDLPTTLRTITACLRKLVRN
ncbi:MAG TPA: hypothetical protein VNH44_09200 [Micropepsaceae bacterium]|nr:hypothetical protein [Micropepsaceae bacterium]